jgi:TonB family protein
MLPGSEKRKTRNSAKVNLFLSLTFHSLIVVGIFYFAAREGMLGKGLQTLTVVLDQEKKPEPKPTPKQKEPEPTKEPEPIKPVEVVKITPKITTTAPPPVVETAAAADVAPPPAEPPPFLFEGGKQVTSITDPVQIYTSTLRAALEYNWDRPREMDEPTIAAEVSVAVSKTGEISSPVITKSSGQPKWDHSVIQAITSTKQIKPPPANFPSRVALRFYVAPKTPLEE